MMVSIVADASHGDDRPGWSMGRVLAWIAGTIVALFLAGVAMGFLAAHLDAGTGAKLWGERLRPVVPLVVVAIMAGALALAIRRSWPRPLPADAPEWEHRAAARTRRTIRAWIVPSAALLVPLVAVPLAARMGLGTSGGIALLIASLLLATVGAVAGTAYYMRMVDEQERDANLWCGYLGLSAYMFLYFAQMVVRGFFPELPRMDDAIFAITAAVALITFLRLRFR